MGTFDSIYQNKIRRLEEENQQLKQFLSEAKKPNPDYSGQSNIFTSMGEIFGTFDRNSKAIGKMTPEEAFKLGEDHAREHKGLKTPPHYFDNRHFVAGFNSVK